MSDVRSWKITTEYVSRVAAFVRAGGFAAVASEAAGVPAAVFAAWLRSARGRPRNPLYKQLDDEVRTAAAQSRLAAEIKVFEKRPEVWLRHGPGKETAAAPGWSQAVKPAGPEGPADLLASREVQEALGVLIAALAEFPELRLRIAGLLEAAGFSFDRKKRRRVQG